MIVSTHTNKNYLKSFKSIQENCSDLHVKIMATHIICLDNKGRQEYAFSILRFRRSARLKFRFPFIFTIHPFFLQHGLNQQRDTALPAPTNNMECRTSTVLPAHSQNFVKRSTSTNFLPNLSQKSIIPHKNMGAQQSPHLRLFLPPPPNTFLPQPLCYC